MNEKDLNIEYICEKTLLNKDDELVPIILDLIQESYKAGLCQAEFDNTMNLIEENQELKQKYLNSVADYETTMAENQKLKKQLDYLRSGEYYNQLRFERDMLQNVVNNSEVSKEDKQFIDMTHRNTELLEQQKEFINYLNSYIDLLNDKPDMLEETQKDILKEILQKYREIIGVSDEKK